MLVRLLYCSRAVDDSPAAIDSILSQSRVRREAAAPERSTDFLPFCVL